MSIQEKNIKDFLALLLSFVLWGTVFPIYFTQLKNISAFEVLAHRIFWSFVTLFFIIVGFRYGKKTLKILKDKKYMMRLFFAGATLSINWLLFIYGVSSGNILETSLGYFICPIINIIFGVFLFKESLSKTKKVGVFICFCAILFEVYQLHKIPFIALGIAISWAVYASIKKSIKNTNAILTLFIEMMMLSPLALMYLYDLYTTGKFSFTTISTKIDILLIISGFVTLTPLLLFNYSVTKLKLTLIGVMTYITPTLSFLTAIFMYNEPLNPTRTITFITIWVAITLFSFDSVKTFFKKSPKIKTPR